MLSIFFSLLIEQVVMWLLYLVFAATFWILLLPLAFMVMTPVFVARALVHPSRIRQVLTSQYRKVLLVWMDVSIALLPR